MFYMNLLFDQHITALPRNPKALRNWVEERLVVTDALWREMIDRFGPVPHCQTLRKLPLLNTNERVRGYIIRFVQRYTHAQAYPY
jgi:hypothetical protein